MEEVILKFQSLAGKEHSNKRIDGYWFIIAREKVKSMATFMLENKLRLSTATAIERPDGETDIVYHFISPVVQVNVRTTTKDQCIESISSILPSASWIEREMKDLYAVQFLGHADMRPLVRPNEIPEGFFRKEIAERLLREREAK